MDILNRQFGLLIAYVLPGFVALAGIALIVPAVAGWLRPDQPTSFGAPIYALLAATAVGMVVSCFRWLLIDRIHAVTGVLAPAFNARALDEAPVAFNFLVESHYRYYQFYANSLVAVVFTYSIYRLTTPHFGYGTDAAVLILCTALFAGSRDALAKYRNRGRQLAERIGIPFFEGNDMTNGIDHNQGNSGKSDKAAPVKPTAKPEPSAKPKPQPSAK